MIFSNKATPKYYGIFREKVLRKEILINREIEMEMNRIDGLINNPEFYYDEAAVEGWIKFCNNELTLTDGRDLELLESFKLWGEQVYCWYYYKTLSVFVPNSHGGGSYVTKKVKRRLTKKQYLIVARGAAKTMYDETHQAYALVCNPATTQQVTTAPTMKQGEEVLSPFRTAIIRARGPLFKFFTYGSINNTTGSRAKRVKLASTKKGIENFISGSLLEIRPMTIDKLQGRRDSVATVDEWLSGVTKEDVIGAIEQGASKLDEYLIIASSSEGTVRNGVGDSIKMELMSILKGDYYAPHISIFWYKLDDISEVSDPTKWIKANPNLGLTVQYETYQLDVERAEKVPAARNDILAKRFGIPMEGYTYFFTYMEIQKHRRRSYWRMPCSLGIDMSQGDDFCAFTFLFPLGNGNFGIKCLSFITSLTLSKLPKAQRLKYNQFINEGSLIIVEGTILEPMDIYDMVLEFIHHPDRDYDVTAVGYDPYGAAEFIKQWELEHPPYGIKKVIQGVKTESIPLGDLKNLAELRKLFFDEEIMSFCMGNAITLEDTNGGRKLLKTRYANKIDNVSALMDAYVAYRANRNLFE